MSILEKERSVHLSLIDPEEMRPEDARNTCVALERKGTSAIMVGGSTVASTSQLDEIVSTISAAVNIPVILFPNNVTGISKHADAIWFMSLLNSNSPYFITGIQALAAPIVKRYNLEAIPLGYLIVGEGSTAAYIGQAHPIPLDKPEVALIYALAAQYLGMRFVYLEAGSRAKKHVTGDMVRLVKAGVDVPVIVGGGIRSKAVAKELVQAGADFIVTGTLIEQRSKSTVEDIIATIQR
jgi:phosphoglycerol geranylgeranyltransferase